MKYSFRNFGLTFLISLVIFGAIAWIIVGSLKNIIESTLIGEVTVGNQYNETNSPIDSPSTDSSDVQDEFKGESFTFLAVALDKFQMTEKDLEKWRNNSDNKGKEEPFSCIEALMLVRADKENEMFIFMSLPTDFIINFKGENMPLGNLTKKINLNNQEQLKILLNEVTSLTGMGIDYYSIIDMEAFTDAVDGIGGFTYAVPQDMKYEDPEQDLKINFKKGQKLSKGDDFLKALRFVTFNEVEESNNSEFDLLKSKNEKLRNNVHMDFVNMLFDKMLTDDNMISVAIWIPELFKSTITNFGLDIVKDNIDLIFSYKEYTRENVTYSQNYINYTSDRYSDYEPNKDSIKISIAKISSVLNKAS